MRNATIGVIEEISTLEKKVDWDWTKVMTDRKTLSGSREMSFIYCQVAPVEIDIDFHQLWGETIEIARWLHSIVGGV